MTLPPKPKQNQLVLGPPHHTFYRGVPRASEEKSGDPGHPNQVLGREGSRRRESVGSSGALCLMRRKRLNKGILAGHEGMWEERGPRKIDTM